MSALVWDQLGERLYETGVSKGVFYKTDGWGVSWNGLVSVSESVGDSNEPVYFDGLKFNDIVTLGDFEGRIRAFTFPDEFLAYEGTGQDQSGFFVTGQPKKTFGLSYQTKIGNDVLGQDAGYKIHVLYNLTAMTSDRDYETMSLDVEALEFEWDIVGIPEPIETFRPTVHVIFDSTKINPKLLIDIEDILYGSEEQDAFLPSLKGLSTFIRKWERLVITDHGDGTWSADSPLEDVIVMLDETSFEITSDTAVYVDADTYTIESSDKNEEDIWPP